GAHAKRPRPTLFGRFGLCRLRSVPAGSRRATIAGACFGHRGGYRAPAVHNYHVRGSAWGRGRRYPRWPWSASGAHRLVMLKSRLVTVVWPLGHLTPNALERDDGRAMTEGQSVTAAPRDQGAGAGIPAAPDPAAPADASAGPTADASAGPATGAARLGAAPPAAAAPPPAAPPSSAAPPGPDAGTSGDGASSEPSVRVNAQLIESAILALRKPIVAAQLPLEAPGVEEARAERRKLLGQIDDYLLPRLRESGSPVLVALVGSTGAGKSPLANSIVGAHVSMTGIRRPTTNSPVLACHPDDVDWFAENVFLPTVPRVRQEGLARSGRDGLLVLAASEGMPKGVALLDTPDIDSVVQEHRAFAHQFLDASDLWLFMTTASRYADAAVWDLLQHARDRGAALGIVLSRVNEASAAQLIEHFGAMLEANGLGSNQRFLILETVLSEGMLPAEASGPIRQWLAEAAQSDRRVAVLTQTMSGVLDTFPTRVPTLATHVEAHAGHPARLLAPRPGALR